MINSDAESVNEVALLMIEAAHRLAWLWKHDTVQHED
jgi:hypothetical protein